MQNHSRSPTPGSGYGFRPTIEQNFSFVQYSCLYSLRFTLWNIHPTCAIKTLTEHSDIIFRQLQQQVLQLRSGIIRKVLSKVPISFQIFQETEILIPVIIQPPQIVV